MPNHFQLHFFLRNITRELQTGFEHFFEFVPSDSYQLETLWNV